MVRTRVRFQFCTEFRVVLKTNEQFVMACRVEQLTLNCRWRRTALFGVLFQFFYICFFILQISSWYKMLFSCSHFLSWVYTRSLSVRILSVLIRIFTFATEFSRKILYGFLKCMKVTKNVHLRKKNDSECKILHFFKEFTWIQKYAISLHIEKPWKLAWFYYFLLIRNFL